MAEDVSTLFEDYASRYVRGERPDPREYLTRAGEGADELGDLIDRFVAGVPPPAPSEERVAMMNAWLAGEPPLLALRTSRGMRRKQVVEALIRILGLDPAKEKKVAGYYHRLETGLLDPSRVDRRVFDAFAQTLKTRVAELVTWRPAPRELDVSLFRTQAAPAAPPTGLATRARPEEEPDEIDRLFGAGS
jgi:hypothetical protein